MKQIFPNFARFWSLHILIKQTLAIASCDQFSLGTEKGLQTYVANAHRYYSWIEILILHKLKMVPRTFYP